MQSSCAASSRGPLARRKPRTARAEDKKEQVITRLVEVRERIVLLVASLPPGKQDEIFLGEWSVKDLLAHLIGWDLANLAMVQEILAGKLPGFYAHYDPDWRSYNAQLVARHKVDDLTELLSSVWAWHGRLIQCLQTVPAEELGRDRGLRYKGYPVTIAGELEVEIRDEEKHYRQLRSFSDSSTVANLKGEQDASDPRAR